MNGDLSQEEIILLDDYSVRLYYDLFWYSFYLFKKGMLLKYLFLLVSNYDKIN